MIWLALDVGTVRIGLAKSDPTGALASPIGFIDGRDVDHAVSKIRRMAEEIKAESILIGVPLSDGGVIGEMAAKVLDFVDKVRARIDLPVVLEDESYTSADGHQALGESGHKRKSHKKKIDAAAAAIMLQRFLDRGQPQDQSIFSRG